MKNLRVDRLKFFTTDSVGHKPINPKSPLVYLSVLKRQNLYNDYNLIS